MRIPIYTAQQDLPAVGPNVKASINTLAIAPTAMQQMGNAAMALAEKMRQAEQVRELSDAKVGVRKALDDIRAQFEQRTDYDQFEPEYEQKITDLKERFNETIKDPEVKQAFRPFFENQVLQTGVYVRARARSLQVEHGKASYAGNMDTLAQLYSSATDAHARNQINAEAQIITAGAINAGYITAPTGYATLQAFRASTQMTDAMADLRKDPHSFDAAKYKGISARNRILLQDQAQRLADARDRQVIQEEERKEKQAAEERKARQEDAAYTLTLKALQGGLREDELMDAGQQRILARSDLLGIEKILEKRETAIKDDPFVKTHLLDWILQGHGSRDIIFEAFNNGQITGATAQDYLEKLHQVQKAGDITKSPEYKDALKYISVRTNPHGMFDKFDESGALREEFAKEEFYARVMAGEPIQKVRDDVASRYAKGQVPSTALPKPLFGTKDNLPEAFKQTQAAYDAKRIDYKTYAREMMNIKALLDLETTQAEQAQAPAGEPANKIKSKIQERKAAQ